MVMVTMDSQCKTRVALGTTEEITEDRRANFRFAILYE